MSLRKQCDPWGAAVQLIVPTSVSRLPKRWRAGRRPLVTAKTSTAIDPSSVFWSTHHSAPTRRNGLSCTWAKFDPVQAYSSSSLRVAKDRSGRVASMACHRWSSSKRGFELCRFRRTNIRSAPMTSCFSLDKFQYNSMQLSLPQGVTAAEFETKSSCRTWSMQRLRRRVRSFPFEASDRISLTRAHLFRLTTIAPKCFDLLATCVGLCRGDRRLLDSALSQPLPDGSLRHADAASGRVNHQRRVLCRHWTAHVVRGLFAHAQSGLCGEVD